MVILRNIYKGFLIGYFMKIRTLINLLDKKDSTFVLDEIGDEDYKSALHDLLKNESCIESVEEAKNLVESTALFHVRNYEDFEGYCEAYGSALIYLDELASEADELLELKKSEKSMGRIQKFFRQAVNYDNYFSGAKNFKLN